jgi:ankyrin repeat protein
MSNSLNSAFASSDLAIGNNYRKKILYVQSVDHNKDKMSEIPDLFLEDIVLQGRKKFCDLKFSEYVNNPKSNIEVLKSGLQNDIQQVYVYSNPLPFAARFNGFSLRETLKLRKLPSIRDVTIHAFVVFQTFDGVAGKEMWWSIEKNGLYTVLQHSSNKTDVVDHIYDADKNESVKRLEPVEELTNAASSSRLSHVLNIIWETRLFSTKYHLIKGNCQHFASLVFEKANYEGQTWWSNRLVNSLAQDNPKNDFVIDSNAIRHYWLLESDRRDFYLLLIEKRGFEEFLLFSLFEKYPINERDSQGYTLLEWAEAFSRDDVKNYLIEKGADESEFFRHNVFFIALQYLDSQDELNEPKLSFEGIDITGVNQTGDTSVHLSLYGGKWKIAKKMLEDNTNQLNLNAINSLKESPIHLAAKLESCPMKLFEILLNQMDPEKLNIIDHCGYAPLHYAADVRVPNEKKIKLLLARGADINFKSKKGLESRKGFTALHYVLWHNQSKATVIALQALLSHVKLQDDGSYVEEADVNLEDNSKRNALHYACWWSDIPADVFKNIFKKTTKRNGQDKFGNTALITALKNKNKVATKQLLKCCKKLADGTVERCVECVNVNLKNNNEETALHWAAAWPHIPEKLFQKILDISEDVNVEDITGKTPFDFAVTYKSMTGIDFLIGKK